MTPLSDALRRIEAAADADLRERALVLAPPIDAAAPLPTTCFDTIGECEDSSSIEVPDLAVSSEMPSSLLKESLAIVGGLSDADYGCKNRVISASERPPTSGLKFGSIIQGAASEISGDALSERAKLPRRLGKVNLLGDLTGDLRVAYQAAAQPVENGATEEGDVGMVVVVRPGAAPTGPSISAREEQADDLRSIRWPVPGESQFTPWSESVPRIALPIGSAGMASRDWVLFLDDCRELFGSVSVVAPVACNRELAWLARRCDTVRLLALAGVSTAAAARQASLRLAQVGGVQPTCLLVEPSLVAAAA